jgi:1,4-alpha-glucan branching enzyme
MRKIHYRSGVTAILAVVALSNLCQGQAPAAAAAPAEAPRRAPMAPQVVSPEVGADGKVTFRILAPKAEAVRLTGGDMPGLGQGAPMTKGENGVWEVTQNSLPQGYYRYHFDVDGVSVIDPRNPARV